MNFEFDHAAQVVPDIAEAVAWYRRTLPNTRVIHQDATWAFIEAGGAKIAFVVKDQHPGHLAWRVDDATLETLAREHGKEIKPTATVRAPFTWKRRAARPSKSSARTTQPGSKKTRRAFPPTAARLRKYPLFHASEKKSESTRLTS
jgi:catechol 2,3-dioxygenase-like lactoylglutathione lyase family enzyme